MSRSAFIKIALSQLLCDRFYPIFHKNDGYEAGTKNGITSDLENGITSDLENVGHGKISEKLQYIC